MNILLSVPSMGPLYTPSPQINTMDRKDKDACILDSLDQSARFSRRRQSALADFTIPPIKDDFNGIELPANLSCLLIFHFF